MANKKKVTAEQSKDEMSVEELRAVVGGCKDHVENPPKNPPKEPKKNSSGQTV